MKRAWRWLIKPGYSPLMLFYMSNFSAVIGLTWAVIFAIYRVRDPESVPSWLALAFAVILGISVIDIVISTVTMRRRNRRIGKPETIRMAEDAWLQYDYDRVAELLAPFRNDLDWVLTRRLIVSEKRRRHSPDI
ncbi:hypothetical protein [Aeromicrobium sp. 9AM]|uniref:hypothetical protein n=1 Tax=Aeromicrobium sp. 9AM TaxID=2653126 RepID=UPI0012F1982C|nr:hypothetical protein [Aeromicrobium sp. 9AM]VXA93019.1 hypothetical protein AERO9AM_10002 [Aeromicrobium sp. 9AM]